tara:strand:+ start:197 stop:334 length:138 start_codon:yes stop_codon:yes gene_type:complete
MVEKTGFWEMQMNMFKIRHEQAEHSLEDDQQMRKSAACSLKTLNF